MQRGPNCTNDNQRINEAQREETCVCCKRAKLKTIKVYG